MHKLVGKVSLFGALLIGGLSAQQAIADAAGDIMVASPYVRAVPAMQPNSAAFMGLHNHSAHNHALVSASSPAAEVVELHTHTMVDGMMQMRRIDKIKLPAHDVITLQPGGLHVMLIGLKAPLNVGDMTEITLTYEDGSSKQVSVPVKSVTAPGMPMDHSGHGMDHAPGHTGEHGM